MLVTLSEADKLFIKILGHFCCLNCDKLCYSFSVNLSKKRRNLYMGEPLHYGQDVEAYVKKHSPLTKRSLSVVAGSTWDNSNYLLPVAMCTRFMFRRICAFLDKPLDWDDPIGEQNTELVISTLRNMQSAHGVCYDRCYAPKNGYITNEHSPLLAITSDGSQEGICSTIYACFELPDDDERKIAGTQWYHVALVKSSTRLSPLSGLSIPAAELSAVHLATKLKELLLTELDGAITFSKIVYLSDSTSAISQVGARHNLFSPWYLARLRDIQGKASFSQFFKVDGLRNPSDYPSKLPKQQLGKMLR